MLHRYWLVIYPGDPYCSKNIGVTAFSPQQARLLAKEEFKKIGWLHITDDSIDQANIIEDIDIQLLDQNHIITNMGLVTLQGVWYPNLNYGV